MDRPAVPTPDGIGDWCSTPTRNLTNQNPYPPATSYAGDHADRRRQLGRHLDPGREHGGLRASTARSTSRTSPARRRSRSRASRTRTTLDLRQPINGSHSRGDTVTEIAPYELYRYSYAQGAGRLQCVSCDPATRVNEVGPTPPIGSAHTRRDRRRYVRPSGPGGGDEPDRDARSSSTRPTRSCRRTPTRVRSPADSAR